MSRSFAGTRKTPHRRLHHGSATFGQRAAISRRAWSRRRQRRSGSRAGKPILRGVPGCLMADLDAAILSPGMERCLIEGPVMAAPPSGYLRPPAQCRCQCRCREHTGRVAGLMASPALAQGLAGPIAGFACGAGPGKLDQPQERRPVSQARDGREYAHREDGGPIDGLTEAEEASGVALLHKSHEGFIS